MSLGTVGTAFGMETEEIDGFRLTIQAVLLLIRATRIIEIAGWIPVKV